MHIQREHPIQIQFSADETNAARRLVWRLVSEHGFAPTNRAGGLSATIDGREYRLSFSVTADGNSALRTENVAAESLLPALAGGIFREWQDPALGPTSRRIAARSDLALRVEALLRAGDSHQPSH